MIDIYGHKINVGDRVAVTGGTRLVRDLKIVGTYSKTGVYVEVGPDIKWPVETRHIIKL